MKILFAIAGVAAVVLGFVAYSKANQSTTEDGGDSGDVSVDNADSNDVTEGSDMTVSGGITHDPATWPQGDNLWNIARAIAIAEGANVAGSNPDKLNNPGDISDGMHTFGAEYHSGSNVTHFPDKQTGWQWLYDKLQNIANGKSTAFSADWTWTQIAQKWAGNWSAWVANVTRELGVDENSTFADYVNS